MLVEGGANGSSLLVADGNTNTIDTLDASGLSGDVIVEGVQGYVQLGQSGVNLPGAKIALDANGEDGFETIITGAGNDRLIGNEGVAETFDPGLGYNQIEAGNQSGIVDFVGYSAHSAVSGTVADSQSGNAKTKTFAFSN